MICFLYYITLHYIIILWDKEIYMKRRYNLLWTKTPLQTVFWIFYMELRCTGYYHLRSNSLRKPEASYTTERFFHLSSVKVVTHTIASRKDQAFLSRNGLKALGKVLVPSHSPELQTASSVALCKDLTLHEKQELAWWKCGPKIW